MDAHAPAKDGARPVPPAPRYGPVRRLFAPFERIIDPFIPTDRPAPPSGLMPFVLWGLRDVRVPVILLAVFSLAFGVVEAVIFYLIGGLVDRAAAAGPENFFAVEWPILAVLLVAVIILKPVTQLIQSAFTSLVLGPGVMSMTTWRLHRHTLGQAMSFFEEDFSGRIAQKETQTAMALATVTIDAFTSVGMLIAYLVAMAVLLGAADLWLAAVVVLWAGAFAWALRWGIPIVRKRAKERAEARASVTGQLVDTLSHMKTVKLFAHGAREEESARRAITRYRDAAIAFGHPMMAMRLILAVMNIVVTLALVGGALYLWTAGDTGLGVVAMAAMMTLRLTAMSGWIAHSALILFAEFGTIEDGAQTLSPPHDVVDREGAIDPAPVTGAVAFHNVVFQYGRVVGGVRALDFDVAPGEKVGLVGRSGAGKSTAISLLLRLYDVEEGTITLDGRDIRTLTQDGLRRAISTVTQETAIFNRSALDNILYGRPDATEEEALEAAKKARAHDFIAHIRDSKGREGYGAHLGERGVKLSGGQRQRIALARAILKDAPVLVLDEATSALDSEVEADIQAALADVMANKTVIAIAHRLSTVAAMDRILVMDGGTIVEEGTHEGLLSRSGRYAELWKRQSGGFLAMPAQ
ncbi:MAG: ABC transporter ATP-binding protein [Devosia sp.]